jgi:hypothetical protein
MRNSVKAGRATWIGFGLDYAFDVMAGLVPATHEHHR